MRRSAIVWIALLAVPVPATARAAGGDGKTRAAPAAKKKRVEVGGRVFFRAEADRTEGQDTRVEESIASARAEIDYRWEDWLRTVVEAEVSGRARVRDAYVLARHRRSGLGLRAGNFKEPVSAIELASAWTLPTARRGLLNDVLVDNYQIAGRRPGLQVEWKGPGPREPSAALGVFQASDVYGDLLEERGVEARTVAGRVEARPSACLGVGAFGELRAKGEIGATEIEHFWTAGLDLVWDAAFARGGGRVWADALAGSTWVDFIHTDDNEATFLAARVIAAWRWGGLATGRRYLEPYVRAGAIEPDTDIRDDLTWEVAAGLNVGAWRRARATLELERREVGRYAPPVLGAGLTPLRDRTLALLQIGVGF